jgi:FtsH-binding integral membrane protein
MAADTLTGNPYASFGYSVAEAAPADRITFIRRTYTHLAMAVYAFAALLWLYFQTPFADWVMAQVQAAPWLLLASFGGFMVVSWVANRWAMSETSVVQQYAGLIGYVFAQSILILPMMWFAQDKVIELAPGQNVNVIGAAGLVTLVMFGGLTALVWLTGKDFSFLGYGLGIAGMGIFALIVAGFFFQGLNLGIWFSVALIVFASAYILYDTSNVMNHYRPTQHVAASLALFSSVALLFWYVLRLFIALSNRD